jgi:AraC-like DNA-binding protein
VHSLPVEPQPVPCSTVPAVSVSGDLGQYVLGYGGFRSGAGVALRHRVLPAVLAVLVIDVDSGDAVVTGPRTTAVLAAERWGHGVTVGLTPAGVAAVLGMPMGELAEAIVPFDAPGLIERLAATEAWADRFAVLNGWMRRAAHDANYQADTRLVAAWRWLQRSDPPGVDEAAALLGVRRRRLEQAFQQYVGVTPKAVARVARFQRAVGMLSGQATVARVAAECCYADQPHLTREVRAMSGCTPAELRRHLHAAQSFKTATAMPS